MDLLEGGKARKKPRLEYKKLRRLIWRVSKDARWNGIRQGKKQTMPINKGPIPRGLNSRLPARLPGGLL
jgi:hypothetical protein